MTSTATAKPFRFELTLCEVEEFEDEWAELGNLVQQFYAVAKRVTGQAVPLGPYGAAGLFDGLYESVDQAVDVYLAWCRTRPLSDFALRAAA